MTNNTDNKLTLLVDYYAKRVATVGGNGYSEAVLYKSEADGSFQIHTYEKDESMTEEIHKAYKTTSQKAMEIISQVEKENLHIYEGQKSPGLDGKLYVLKFKKEGRLVRITSSNLPEKKIHVISEIGNLLLGNRGEEIK